MLTGCCPNCGKEFVFYESQKKKYCCSECWYEYNKKTHDETNKRKCKMCGEIFIPKYKEQKFCSRKCSDKHLTTLVGEDNPHFKQVAIKCEECGLIFYERASHANHRKFCSYACYNKFQQSDERYKKRMAHIMQKNKEDGKMSTGYTMTKQHEMTIKQLEEMHINYECEYPIKYYLVDIYLPDYNLMIEVNGDYWHSNPMLGYDTKAEVQKKRIRTDKSKHAYVKNQYNIEILYLWENDIIKNQELCKALICKYIEKDGQLDNYHSFNYSIDDTGKLNLNSEIIPAPIEV